MPEKKESNGKYRSRKWQFVVLLMLAGLALAFGMFFKGEFLYATSIFTLVTLLVAAYCGLNVRQQSIYAPRNLYESEDEGQGRGA